MRDFGGQWPCRCPHCRCSPPFDHKMHVKCRAITAAIDLIARGPLKRPFRSSRASCSPCVIPVGSPTYPGASRSLLGYLLPSCILQVISRSSSELRLVAAFAGGGVSGGLATPVPSTPSSAGVGRLRDALVYGTRLHACTAGFARRPTHPGIRKFRSLPSAAVEAGHGCCWCATFGPTISGPIGGPSNGS